ncbi:cadherin-like domain-containing protein [Flammeovirga kamogawensis]|uniref:T9SS type A sorting domain-containing protein n=1 Tax=Flammeovirga kamogawensis TaxID=373891 RepID=A0ABX8GRG0_9BACT|nr:cadherin-like domain-containing protein [Flammeovirga kamogawensis]MBB6462118.1 hypothetical protein [Flammeovirga kamogawensis]QWG05852.1 T9SS type A sorting domain-containing protein [Flammeovirga kamogawensis]TRX67677.1 T9SS type A sorting domain-containing protein [Flammeovirga kamogawensis]
MKYTITRILFFVCFYLLQFHTSIAQPTLNSADLVVVARNTDLDDQFAIVALADIPANSIIFLTDEGYDNSGFTFDGSEDVFKWTVGNNITAGTIIRFTNESTTTLAIKNPNHGTLFHSNGSSDMNLSAGDQLFIYQTDNNTYNGTIQRLDGSSNTEAGMIYAFNGDNSSPNTHGWLDSPNTHTSAASQAPDNMTILSTVDGTGNASYANANGMLTQAQLKGNLSQEELSAGEYDNYIYDGPTSSATKPDWLIRIHTVSNWLASNTDSVSLYTGALSNDLSILPANTNPVITINSSSSNYNEGSSPLQLDSNASISDSDWDGGTLTVQITTNADTYDEISIPDNIVNNINTSSSNLQDGSTVFGTLSATEGTVTNSTTLTITFNSNASSSLVQQTLRAVSYRNTSQNPATSNRIITININDSQSRNANGTKTIGVTSLDDDAPIINVNNNLSINENANGTISSTFLSSSDIDDDDTSLIYTITSSSSYGQVENSDNPEVSISSFTQQNIIDNKIQYVHNGSSTSSDSFTFKVADDGSNELSNQTFNITITPIDDDAPTITTNNGLALNEGASLNITSTELGADDSDSDNTTLIFTITAAPSNGQIENSDNPGVSITSFTQQNISDGKIQYVHNGTNTTSDTFTFKIADGVPNENTGQTFNITINPIDDDAPTITTNNDLALNEGVSLNITSTELGADDSDSDNTTLLFTITAAPSNGQIENSDNPGISINSFTQQNISNSKIQYVHNGSNTTSDTFTFKIADGVPNENTGQTFNITINPIDDDTPTITTNNGLALNEGASLNITSTELGADDSDSDNTTLIFTISAAPSNGQIENSDNSGVSINSFTQQDISDGKIQYVHDGTNTTSDTFTFKIADGVPNENTGQTFNITINPIDDDTPTITTNNGLALNEGASLNITSTELGADDSDSDNTTLILTITAAPSNGQIENSDNPGVSITSFTQQNISDGKIQYVHNGTNTTSDTFTFKIADGVPNENTGQTFNITINPIDDDAPTITTNNGLALNEGASLNITSTELGADDSDSDNTTLIFTIIAAPSNGQIENSDNPGVSINSFTQQNISDGKIQYVHNGTNTTSDTFTFRVTDGASNEINGQTFNITINPVDDDAPVIIVNNGISLNIGDTATITTLELEIDDSDSDNLSLQFIITTNPNNGYLENTDDIGNDISSFTQQDLIDQKIRYINNGNSADTDTFTFTVSDSYSNQLIDQTFLINLSTVTSSEYSLFDKISLFPNPIDNQLNINFEKISKGEIQIISLDGKVVSKKTFDNQRILNIDFNGFKSGFYFIRIHNGDQNISYKVLKK